MKVQEIKAKNNNYSIFIGKNILNILPKKIKITCPQTKKIALIFDTGVPDKHKKFIKKNLKGYQLTDFNFNANELDRKATLT